MHFVLSHDIFTKAMCHLKAHCLELCRLQLSCHIRAGFGCGSTLSPFAYGCCKVYFSKWISYRLGRGAGLINGHLLVILLSGGVRVSTPFEKRRIAHP